MYDFIISKIIECIINMSIFLVILWIAAIVILSGIKRHYSKHINDIDEWNKRGIKNVEEIRKSNPYDDYTYHYNMNYDPQIKANYDEASMYLDIIYPF